VLTWRTVDDGNGMWRKPDFYGPEHGSAFQCASVVAAYPFRPPYPEAVFDRLGGLLTGTPRVVLDLGCGTGAMARRLTDIAERVDALDVSASMVEAGKRLPGGDHPKLRWMVGRAEDAPLDPPYALVTAAASLHWMDWPVVLPRLARVLTSDGVLVIIDDAQEPPPWQADLVRIILQHTTNPTLDLTYDWIAEIERQGWFRLIGRERTPAVPFRQSVEAYVESFHGRASFARERMGASNAAAFDAAVRALVTGHQVGDVELHVFANITWGRPLPSRDR